MRSRWVPIGLATIVLAGCGSTKVVTHTVTHTTPPVTRTATVTVTVPKVVDTITRTATVTTTVTVVHKVVAAPVGTLGQTSADGVLTLTGQGTENMGTVKVPSQSILKWSCPSCAQDNFIVNNDENDSNSVGINALDQTSGQTIIDSGTYHDFDVEGGSGPWTVTITPGR